MTKFKISIHCGPVNTFVVEEHEDRMEALRKYENKFIGPDALMGIGDVLINKNQITFVVVEELVEKAEEPAAGATIEV